MATGLNIDPFENAPSKPDPPQVVEDSLTHHSVELEWRTRNYSEFKQGKAKFVVEMEGRSPGKPWNVIYSGYAHRRGFDHLDPSTAYKFRVKVVSTKDSQESEPSSPTYIVTEREPTTGDMMHRAINRNDYTELQNIITRTQGVKHSTLIDAPDKYGLTPLMNASNRGHAQILQLLLDHGANIHATDIISGRNSLMVACSAGHEQIVRMLHAKGARMEAVDTMGRTALHYAVDSGSDVTVNYMVSHAAQVDISETFSKWTPLLRTAAVSGSAAVARILLDAGADINAQDKDGKTTLMIASVNGHDELARLLIDRGCDLKITTAHRQTARDMAVTMHRSEITKAIDAKIQQTGRVSDVKASAFDRDATATTPAPGQHLGTGTAGFTPPQPDNLGLGPSTGHLESSRHTPNVGATTPASGSAEHIHSRDTGLSAKPTDSARQTPTHKSFQSQFAALTSSDRTTTRPTSASH